VLAGSYNDSLLDEAPQSADGRSLHAFVITPQRPPARGASAGAGERRNGADAVSDDAAEARRFVMEFVADRLPGTHVPLEAPIAEVFDSLLLLDFFLHIENAKGAAVSLDQLSTCETFAAVAELLATHCKAEGLSRVG
jgi:hypothetical protein